MDRSTALNAAMK